MKEPENIIEMKQVLEAALLTSPQPLSLDDMLKLFAGRMERATLRMLLDELKEMCIRDSHLTTCFNGHVRRYFIWLGKACAG